MPKDPIDAHIGARLRRARDDRRMTLEEVGRRLMLSYQQIRKYESGDNRVSASTLFRFAELFGVEPSFFFDGLSRSGRDRSGEALEDMDGGLEAALRRIEDAEVRRHLEGLISVLNAQPKSCGA